MTAPVAQPITSRDNPLLVRLRKLLRDGAGYRKDGEVWLEGEHLCSALRQRGWRPAQAVVAESAWAKPPLRELAHWAPRIALLPDALFDSLSTLESPSRLGFLWPLPARAPIDGALASIVLDRVQDAGNVGSILRSASAFGFTQVLALRGTASLWSPKVLRAGMGAHFALRLIEGLQPADLDTLAVPWIGSSLQASTPLHRTVLPFPCAWLFGHEGQGVDAALQARCAQLVRIAQPGGEESLNVAAAAAICLHESMRQADADRPRDQ
ncbi:TrmH family RNA methyltransferase [Aquabacterium humicola]|uniref:TrmH family RNA methyltransferase n=1 Tax=Aquabacterium humicola TaxID=3237377 RepID=UPI002542C8D8|nr:RNA methyltransferase [Rubrivivax pictus]